MKTDILENVSLPWRDCWLRATLKTVYIGEINVCWRLLYAESAGDYCMFLLNLAGDYLRWRQIICIEIICVEIICIVCSPRWSPMKLHLNYVIEPWATFYLPALKTAKGRWRLLLNNHSRTLISAVYAEDQRWRGSGKTALWRCSENVDFSAACNHSDAWR